MLALGPPNFTASQIKKSYIKYGIAELENDAFPQNPNYNYSILSTIRYVNSWKYNSIFTESCITPQPRELNYVLIMLPSSLNSVANCETISAPRLDSKVSGGCVKYLIFPEFQSPSRILAAFSRSGIPPRLSLPIWMASRARNSEQSWEQKCQ